jgi:hypothetical protein
MRTGKGDEMRGAIDVKAIEAATASDRQFFIDHPEATHRDRPFVPGEGPLPPIPPNCQVFIRVHQIAPGFRIREPLLVELAG